jgi:hypothetical protein
LSPGTGDLIIVRGVHRGGLSLLTPRAVAIDPCRTRTRPPNEWCSGALSVAFMDPYITLGVPRGCSRQEVKDAFRARAWYVHPDRGGENESFIRLCSAYKQILRELDQRPYSRLPNLGRTSRPSRSAVPPDSMSKTEVIFLDEVASVRWPPKPSDPNWEPDLIVLDEVSPDSRLPRPSDPMTARKTYRSWLHRAAFESGLGRSVWRSDWVGTLGTLIIVALIVGSMWACWDAWEYAAKQAEEAARMTR